MSIFGSYLGLYAFNLYTTFTQTSTRFQYKIARVAAAFCVLSAHLAYSTSRCYCSQAWPPALLAPLPSDTRQRRGRAEIQVKGRRRGASVTCGWPSHENINITCVISFLTWLPLSYNCVLPVTCTPSSTRARTFARLFVVFVSLFCSLKKRLPSVCVEL